jgi:hypothetical protein
MKTLLFLRVVAILLPVPAAAETNSFLEAHCFDCHDSETQKGKLDLTTLKLDDANFETRVKVHDRVRSGEMPPTKKPRPEVKEMEASLATWAEQLIAVDSAK